MLNRRTMARTLTASMTMFLCATAFTPVAGADAGARGMTDGGGMDVISVPGSSTVVHLWQAPDARGELAPHYAISFDGGATFSEPRSTAYELKLRHGEFDPLGPEAIPLVEPGFEAGEDTNLYIVQFVTQPLEAYREATSLNWIPKRATRWSNSRSCAGSARIIPRTGSRSSCWTTSTGRTSCIRSRPTTS
jgi:hypothetical protein